MDRKEQLAAAYALCAWIESQGIPDKWIVPVLSTAIANVAVGISPSSLEDQKGLIAAVIGLVREFDAARTIKDRSKMK